MNIFDIVILLFILSGALIGFKRGFTTELVSAVGMIIIVIIAFLIKNPISEFMYNHLPFFDFGGILKGVSVLNIAIYEIIAFLIAVSILTIIFKVVLLTTKVFEKLLKFTIILGIPSKIAGAVIGIIENYIWVFIILYIISLPLFNINTKSNYKDKILNNTPVLSSFTKNNMKVFDEFSTLKDKYKSNSSPSEFNRETLDLFLKYDIITVKSVESLIAKNKLTINNVDSILEKYKEG